MEDIRSITRISPAEQVRLLQNSSLIDFCGKVAEHILDCQDHRVPGKLNINHCVCAGMGLRLREMQGSRI